MGGVLLLANCSQTQPAPQAQTPHYTMILRRDGTRPDAVSQADTSSLSALRHGGVDFTDNPSTCSGFTVMNAASDVWAAVPMRQTRLS